MGYWSALFYEDQNTWTSAVADVCSTIVSYGVDIPWCVCSNSWNVINMATDYATFLFMLVSNALHLDAWWRFEYTVVTAVTLLNIPFFRMRCGNNFFKIASTFFLMLTMLMWTGCFLEATAGVQTGLVFGGKLFYPSLFVLSLVFQAVKLILCQLDKDLYGPGYNDDAKKDDRLTKTLALYKNALSCESVFFLALAAFGLPQWEQNPDLSTWLAVFPFLALYKDVKEYYDANPLPEDASSQKQNGDVAAKVKAVEAKKAAEPAKKDEKKEETPATSEEVKKPSGLEACINNTCSTVCRVACTVTKPVCDLVTFVYSKITSLPWETISNLTLRYSLYFTYTFIYWKLTDDCIVLGFPLFSLLAPMVITKFAAGKVSKSWENFLRELCMPCVAGLQYYLFKNNIIQYN